MIKSKSHIRKIHLFSDCISLVSVFSREEIQITEDISKCTCGQCKGRILNAIREKDWINLNEQTISTLKQYFDIVRTTI